MMIANRTKAALLAMGLVAVASLPAARADTQKAPQAPLYFVNDDGQLMVVDPPAANWKPQMVAVPLTTPAAKNAASPSGK
jgi:hypothetical protein